MVRVCARVAFFMHTEYRTASEMIKPPPNSCAQGVCASLFFFMFVSFFLPYFFRLPITPIPFTHNNYEIHHTLLVLLFTSMHHSLSHTHTHTHIHTHSLTHTHSRTRARARTHTHTHTHFSSYFRVESLSLDSLFCAGALACLCFS
jgi:hypothetical protein